MSTGSNLLLFKTAVIIIVFCFAECVAGNNEDIRIVRAGSCLKYGHSCWGGHGKRNGVGVGGPNNDGGGQIIRGKNIIVPDGNTRWYLSRLVQAPPEFKLWRDGHERRLLEKRTPNKHIQNDSEVDTDLTNRNEAADDEQSVESIPEDTETEEIVVLEEPSRNLGQKLQLYKLMKKKAAMLN